MRTHTERTQQSAPSALEVGPPGRVVHRTPGIVTYAVLAVWVAAVSIAIATGSYEDAGNPPVALMATVGLPILGFAAAYRLSDRFRAYVLELDLRLVVAAQLWRVVGVAFLFVMATGELDAGFAVPAGIGDIATGVAAIVVVASLWNGTLSRTALYAFTVLGVGDFLVAIVTGLSLRPEALDLWPLILFPTLAVPVFFLLHVIALLQSRHGWEDRVAASSAMTTASG